ncbi:hypothetical protein B0A50_06279 [Salinomyces thailandicus]|uniref:Uncharacterized protein n=1 Tax=Salinomyces thailandicus TaxID=706561 RepID=A0A4U0TTY5_9PEZI|nr:hypothetical protein B0A50_06279 [Salinomyces thailandica]
MTDDGEARSKKWRGKWAKVLEKKDSISQPNPNKHDNNVASGFDHNVVDFLKPSTEKSAERPKLNVAVAQRWPGVQEVRKASDNATPAGGYFVYRHPRSRGGLSVAFAKTTPEIIGEGGDESEEPVAEIWSRKMALQRSVADRRARSIDDGALRAGKTQSVPIAAPTRQAPAPHLSGEVLSLKISRTDQSSHDDVSPPMQRKAASPLLREPSPPSPPKLRLSRTPTGFTSQDELSPISPGLQVPTPIVRSPVEPGMTERRPQQRFDSAKGGMLSASPSDLMPPAVRRQRDMQASEGMVLRRASALYMNDEHDRSTSIDVGGGFQPSPQFYNTLSEPALSVESPRARLSEGQLSPESALTPDSRSPVADPKYTKRRSGEQASGMKHAAPPESQRFSQTSYPPSYMHSAQQRQPVRARRSVEQPSYMRAARSSDDSSSRHSGDRLTYLTSGNAITESRPSGESSSLPLVEQANYLRRTRNSEDSDMSSPDEQPSYMQSSPHLETPSLSLRTQPMPPKLSSASPESARTPLHSQPGDHMLASEPRGTRQAPMYTQANHSRSSSNRFEPSPSSNDTRNASRENISPRILEPISTTSQSPPSARKHSVGSYLQSPGPSFLTPAVTGQSVPSPYSRGPSPADYFSAPKASPSQAVKSPAAALRYEEDFRPDSAASTRSTHRPLPSPLPLVGQSDPAADMALADFAGRVAHMKAVFRLTAEKERSADTCMPAAWLRTALWWYLTGKRGLESLLQHRSRNAEEPRELLMQPHVDLAKAWWVISDPLEAYDTTEELAPQSAVATDRTERMLQQSVTMLRDRLRGLCASMQKSALMPPHQSLIQGQDTTIWLEYPRFAPDVVAALSGSAGSSLLADSSSPSVVPLDALPLSDTRDSFCYTRFLVSVTLKTDEADTDRVTLPCMLNVLRNRREYQSAIMIASQNELVNVKLGPRQAQSKGLSWHDVSWRASSCSMSISMPRGFDLTVRMQEIDFRTLWNIVQYAKKIERSMRPAAGERRLHEVRLAGLQYAGPSGSNSFPQEKLKACSVTVFEQLEEHRDGSGMRKMHRGLRLLLKTEPSHKSLSSVNHELCKRDPLYFEMITDSAASGTTAMMVRVRDQSDQCRMLLVFADAATRQHFYDVVTGLSVTQEECIVAKVSVVNVDIRPALQPDLMMARNGAMQQSLHWQKLGITNSRPATSDSRLPPTVESERLRIVARHASGCITDRLNLGKGELQLRLPPAATLVPSLQILREPQKDATVSVDTRQSRPEVVKGMGELFQFCQRHVTVRDFKFASLPDLHAFETAITGFSVRYDGVASSFGISRRMMVVPIYHKWQASNVRLQVVQQGNVMQVLAFMEDFSHADALCFQIKSTDTFEIIKGDSKGKKWAVKMVDAKFSLPKQDKGETDPEERVRRQFVNLEGLDYAEEHDDITVGFENEQERDRFAQALPAAATVGRGLTLKRRI